MWEACSEHRPGKPGLVVENTWLISSTLITNLWQCPTSGGGHLKDPLLVVCHWKHQWQLPSSTSATVLSSGVGSSRVHWYWWSRCNMSPLSIHNFGTNSTGIGPLVPLSKWPSRSLNFISLVISCFGLQEEGPQTAHLMSFTWASCIAASVLTGH